MDARQGLGQIAVALIGDDDAGPGLGHQEIGAGDADIGGEKLRTQHRTRFVAELARLDKRPFRVERAMFGAERVGDLLLHQMDGRCDQMARRLVSQLDDVLAKVGLDRGNPVLFQVFAPKRLGL